LPNTCSKDGSIIKHSLKSLESFTPNETPKIIQVAAFRPRSQKGESGAKEGHKGEVWTLAVSDDGKRLVSGGEDGLLGVWEVTEDGQLQWLKALSGHRSSISVSRFEQVIPQTF
jgi:ribosomal RNA-processing protein 9